MIKLVGLSHLLTWFFQN